MVLLNTHASLFIWNIKMRYKNHVDSHSHDNTFLKQKINNCYYSQVHSDLSDSTY